jgi:hypothetical protein
LPRQGQERRWLDRRDPLLAIVALAEDRRPNAKGIRTICDDTIDVWINIRA